MENVLAAGYPYEFVGLLYFAFFLSMNRKHYEAVYTRRSRALTLLAAIVMVGCFPFGYAGSGIGIVVMIAAAIAALLSTVLDAARAKQRR